VKISALVVVKDGRPEGGGTNNHVLGKKFIFREIIILTWKGA
jgi:hypothetical protein